MLIHGSAAPSALDFWVRRTRFRYCYVIATSLRCNRALRDDVAKRVKYSEQNNFTAFKITSIQFIQSHMVDYMPSCTK